MTYTSKTLEEGTAVNGKKKPLLTKDAFKKQPVEFRIGAIISDGMWLDVDKWAKQAYTSVDEVKGWVAEHIKTGELVRSTTGARSYRFPIESVIAWHDENGIDMDQPIVEGTFAPRVWDNMTETEGFLNAPLREVGALTFECQSKVAQRVTEELLGVGMVWEERPGRYKAYGLAPNHLKKILNKVYEEFSPTQYESSITRERWSLNRREIVDFSPAFLDGLMSFYSPFAKKLVKSAITTISIFIPEADDQESQVNDWVLTAVKKFDQSASVPFAGYLNTVLKRWPYDLPTKALGKDLSNFQRQRAKALASLKELYGLDKDDKMTTFPYEEIAREMGLDYNTFVAYEEKHNVWLNMRHSKNIYWDTGGDERASDRIGFYNASGVSSDIVMLGKISRAIVATALETENYSDAESLITQLDTSSIDTGKLDMLSEDFRKEFKKKMNELSK